jgi:hypothetical protein
MKTERDGVTVGWMRQPMNPSLNTMHRLRSICSLNPTRAERCLHGALNVRSRVNSGDRHAAIKQLSDSCSVGWVRQLRWRACMLIIGCGLSAHSTRRLGSNLFMLLFCVVNCRCRSARVNSSVRRFLLAHGYNLGQP